MRLKQLLRHVTSSLWFVPVLCVLAGVGISFGTIALDRYFDYEALPSSLVGGPDAATEILGTVAASMVSLTALVLTITMVVVQLAMGQFSPRIVQRILQDKPSQLAIGLFVATFVHCDPRAPRGDEQRRRHRQRAGHRGRDGLRARPRQHRGARRCTSTTSGSRCASPPSSSSSARTRGSCSIASIRTPVRPSRPSPERRGVVCARRSGVVTGIGYDDSRRGGAARLRPTGARSGAR